ncbi:MAG: DNA repair protein RecO [Lachnospiraceae bacterium]|nr:DNA repair protein RecO [Lachnospiraceae bacterium]
MQDLTVTTGMIIKTEPIGDFDRRLVILTKERGKITAFVKGARRPNSRFVASTNLFCFGTFRLYEGRTAYTLNEAEITNYFEELRGDFEGAYYGMYFLEIADYYTRENNDERQMLKLLYQSLRALGAKGLDNRLVRCIFEIKTTVINGEFPGIPSDREWQESTKYAVSFIEHTGVEKLFTFTVKQNILEELEKIAGRTREKCMDAHFKSLEILDTFRIYST